MRLRLWSLVLHAAALAHRDPEHRDRLQELAAELRALDGLQP
jgi:hypothetical protein